jgi:hypothetical protein
MRYILFIVAASALVLNGCALAQSRAGDDGRFSPSPLAQEPSDGTWKSGLTNRTFGAIEVPPARNGEILVIIAGGPASNQGQFWLPEQISLATALDLAKLSDTPRNIWVIEADGRAVKHRVLNQPRKELEQVRINHGSRIMVPWDRCFG